MLEPRCCNVLAELGFGGWKLRGFNALDDRVKNPGRCIVHDQHWLAILLC